MNDKHILLTDEEPKYKKKSIAKGQPRSKHKHIYETVLLTRTYHYTEAKTGRPNAMQTKMPTKVCTICGRIDYSDDDESYYVREPHHEFPFIINKELSEKALKLPRWYVDDYFDKFAHEGDKPDNV